MRWMLLVVCLFVYSSAEALDPSQVFQVAARSVVVIVANGKEPKQGSGVTVFAGIVATNCHVVKDAVTISVWGSSSLHHAARLVRRDAHRDICLLEVDGLDTLPAVAEFDHLPHPGERVYAVGSPRGFEQTISEGLISGLREVGQGQLIQTTAPISPGSSGGGLFDAEGHLVGLTTLMVTSGQNLNFAVPVGWIKTAFGVDFQSMLKAPDVHEQDTYLRDAIASLGRPTSEQSKKPQFATMDAQLAHLRWLAAMSDRMRRKPLEFSERIDFLETLWYKSTRAGLEPSLVLAIVERTSGFHKYAVSKNGARGFMQVAAYWSNAVADGDLNRLFHMQTNLRIGCTLLRHYLNEEHGDLTKALLLYEGQAYGREPHQLGAQPDAFVRSVFAARAAWA